jgi:Cu-Zn family superoxide dismutase
MKIRHILMMTMVIACISAHADENTVSINSISEAGVGVSVGTITLSDSPNGLVIKALLKGLPPGEHGFHIHENASCSSALKDGKMVAGLAAGGHFDPNKTGMHQGPDGMGHMGDLPALTIDPDGTSDAILLAPHLKLADILSHAVIIHENGDNYSDTPKPLGGGGARIACGIVN